MTTPNTDTMMDVKRLRGLLAYLPNLGAGTVFYAPMQKSLTASEIAQLVADALSTLKATNDQLATALNSAVARLPRWIPVTESMPAPNKKVMLSYRNAHGNHRTACWQSRRAFRILARNRPTQFQPDQAWSMRIRLGRQGRSCSPGVLRLSEVLSTTQ